MREYQTDVTFQHRCSMTGITEIFLITNSPKQLAHNYNKQYSAVTGIHGIFNVCFRLLIKNHKPCRGYFVDYCCGNNTFLQ